MNKRKWNRDTLKGFIFGAAAAVVAMIVIRQAAVWLPVSSSPTDPTSTAAENKTSQIMTLIDNYYLGDIDKSVLTDSMYAGLVSGLDDQFSVYYTAEEYESISMQNNGEFKGIGVTVANDDSGRLYITGVIEDGPAETAGVQADDIILEINGESFENKDSSEAVTYIQSLESDDVTLKIYRESTDETLEFSMTKAVVQTYSVAWGMTDDNIGYIYISSFTAITAEQFSQARKELEEQGMTSLIIDLRNNPGGLVTGVCDTLSSFMPEGLLVYTEDKKGNREEKYSNGDDPLDIPLVVLVNENSASASEIFAGAVKDYGVGTIVGTTTYGKGIVQDAFKLSDGSVLKLTTMHYYTPKGNDIHKVGITPDVVVENTEDEDLQYEKAVEILNGET